MTREEALQEINETQEYYVNELIEKILDTNNDYLKKINFTSPTGTGKTNMMSLLCNKMNDYYFIITTLSKGQLNIQIANNMKNLVKQNNFVVYGLCDYTSNTKRTAEDILNLLPSEKKIIWLRDEGHINTNKWQEVLKDKCFKVINFSATNKENNGIKCNFTNTMMLRTVHQQEGTPEDALKKLLEIKKQHKKVKNYNPCAIARCLDGKTENLVIETCKKLNLKYINITEENFDMTELCKDDNEYDVIINKFKIVEGIDIRRAHVLYMSNEPSNAATTIQVIGRCRRNALLYRNDVDIFTNKRLLNNTRQCFVFYNVENMKINQDESGELCQAFCDIISCQELKPNSTIYVEEGKLTNGLSIIELEGQTGTYKVEIDETTGFNIIKPEGDFYKTEIISNNFEKLYIYKRRDMSNTKFNNKKMTYYLEYNIQDIISKLSIKTQRKIVDFDYGTGKLIEKIEDCEPYYDLDERKNRSRYKIIKPNIIEIPNDENNFFFKNHFCLKILCNKITVKDLNNTPHQIYHSYDKVINDYESAIVGTDLMKPLPHSDKWIESSAVTFKVDKFCKLNTFIENKYKNNLKEIKPKLFTGKNKFNFDKKCNSCLGYCVEYYSKYLVYGELYMKDYLDQALKESKIEYLNDFLIVRACMLKYKDNMINAFGKSVSKVIQTISIDKLIQNKYAEFVKTVVELGAKTAKFVKEQMNITAPLTSNDKLYDPNLSIKHIKGLADYINKDTIIDIKTTNLISRSHIKQVLAYHYLSTKRSDLDIKKVIVYDSVSGKNITINI